MAISSLGCRGVDRGALVGDLSNETIGVVSGVLGGLDTAVREGNSKGSENISVGVLRLGLLEVNFRVVISHSILIGIRLRGQLLNWGIRGRGSIGWGACSRGSGHNGKGEELVHVACVSTESELPM